MNKDGMGLGGRQTRREDPVKGGRRRLTGRDGGLGGGMARKVEKLKKEKTEMNIFRCASISSTYPSMSVRP